MEKEKYNIKDLLKIIDETSWSLERKQVNLDDFNISDSELLDALNRAKATKNVCYQLKAFSDGHGELVLYRKRDKTEVRNIITFIVIFVSLPFSSILSGLLVVLVYPLWSLGNFISGKRWMTYLEFVDEWSHWMQP